MDAACTPPRAPLSRPTGLWSGILETRSWLPTSRSSRPSAFRTCSSPRRACRSVTRALLGCSCTYPYRQKEASIICRYYYRWKWRLQCGKTISNYDDSDILQITKGYCIVYNLWAVPPAFPRFSLWSSAFSALVVVDIFVCRRLQKLSLECLSSQQR